MHVWEQLQLYYHGKELQYHIGGLALLAMSPAVYHHKPHHVHCHCAYSEALF